MLPVLFRTDPAWARMNDLQGHFDWMLRRISQPIITNSGPHIHIDDTDEGIRIVAEVPGFGRDDVQVEATRDTITLKGERTLEPPEGYSTLRQERSGVSFERTYRLRTEIDPDKVAAKIENGMLVLDAPRAPELQPRQISVNVS